jgi:hypothetical protein
MVRHVGGARVVPQPTTLIQINGASSEKAAHLTGDLDQREHP